MKLLNQTNYLIYPSCSHIHCTIQIFRYLYPPTYITTITIFTTYFDRVDKHRYKAQIGHENKAKQNLKTKKYSSK